MPYNCPTCKKRVPDNCDCISCDNCYKWHHLACTDLTKTQFEVFTREKSFEWICNICVKNSCNKCNILTKQGTSIQCDKCENIYHLGCAGLSKTAYIPTTSWYCYQCHEDIFPFNSISIKQVNNFTFNSLHLDKHPNHIRSIHNSDHHDNPQFSNNCNVCYKKVDRPNSSIPCPSCKCLTHKSCSKLSKKVLDYLRLNPNAWECPTCLSDKFPFMESDDVDIFMDSFNSNWTCGCKSKTRKYIPSPVSNEYKLIINHHNTDDKYNDIYLEDFDINFDLYHSLKPNFKYYETHQFHSMKDKVSNTFSLIHTNICSLQYNTVEKKRNTGSYLEN